MRAQLPLVGIQTIIERGVGLACRHPLLVLLGALLLTGAAAARIPRLEIRSDLSDLLPSGNPSVQRLRTIEERLGTQSDLLIAISSPSFEANVRFGEVLAERIRAELADRVGMVQFRRDRTWFEDHALLYLEVAELERLRDRVKHRIQAEVRRSLVASVGGEETDGEPGAAGDEPPEDEFDARDRAAGAGSGSASAPEALGSEDDQAQLEQLRQRFGQYDVGEYLQLPDGSLVVIKVRPFFPPVRLQQARELEAELRRLIDGLQPSGYHPQLTVEFQGDYHEKQVQIGGITSDIFSSAAICLLALMAVIGLQFRSWRAIPLVLVPTVMAVVWSLGLTQVTVGELNLISSFIFAVLVGMGIDYAIHGMARYQEERTRGRAVEEALRVALRHTGFSNFTAATTTIAVFLTLLLAEFRGFSQFGLIAAMGISLSILCLFAVFPALVVLFERVRPVQFAAAGSTPTRRWTALDGWSPPSWLAWTLLLLSLAAVVGSLWHAPAVGFEYSFTKLSSRVRGSGTEAASPDPQAEQRQHFLDSIGQDSRLAPALVLTETPEQARLVQETFEAILALPEADVEQPDRWASPRLRPIRERVSDPVAWVRFTRQMLHEDVISLWKYVPADQPQKLALLGETRRLIEGKINLFQGREREQLDRLLHYLSAGPVEPARFPAWVQEQFRDRQGRLGCFVLFRARGDKTSFEDTTVLKAAFWELPFGERSFPVAAAYFVLPEAVATIQRDGRLTLGLGLVAVLALLLLQFRRLGDALLVLVPPLLGICSVFGFLWLAGIKLNFFNVVIFPLLLGLGVDNGVHLLHRLQHGQGDGFVYTLRQVGAAMFLTTLTTCIGFAGLFGANHYGLQSLGVTAVAGMTGNLLASLFTLPALLLLRERRIARRAGRARGVPA